MPKNSAQQQYLTWKIKHIKHTGRRFFSGFWTEAGGSESCQIDTKQFFKQFFFINISYQYFN